MGQPNELVVCAACDRHVRPDGECPFCAREDGAPRRKRGILSTLALSAGVSAAALTLQACYGPPSRDVRTERTKPPIHQEADPAEEKTARPEADPAEKTTKAG